eukprot:Selendium_serpulae@DN5581_c0_g1_i2.p1
MKVIWLSIIAVLHGLWDSLSVCRAVHLFIQSTKIRKVFLFCTTVNVVFFMGTIKFLQRIAFPFVHYLFRGLPGAQLVTRIYFLLNISPGFGVLLFRSLVVYPLYIFTLLLNSIGYMEIAESALSILEKEKTEKCFPSSSSPSDASSNHLLKSLPPPHEAPPVKKMLQAAVLLKDRPVFKNAFNVTLFSRTKTFHLSSKVRLPNHPPPEEPSAAPSPEDDIMGGIAIDDSLDITSPISKAQDKFISPEDNSSPFEAHTTQPRLTDETHNASCAMPRPSGDAGDTGVNWNTDKDICSHNKSKPKIESFGFLADTFLSFVLPCVWALESIWFDSIPVVGPFIYWIYSTLLWAHYSFEYRWRSTGLNTEEKLLELETCWLYYLGFGAPYSLIAYFSPIFLDAGVLSLVFPISILTAMCATPRKLNVKLLRPNITSESHADDYHSEGVTQSEETNPEERSSASADRWRSSPTEKVPAVFGCCYGPLKRTKKCVCLVVSTILTSVNFFFRACKVLLFTAPKWVLCH